MPAERFYINDTSLSLNKSVFLDKDEFHHLVHVMRGKPGETVELINGEGVLAQGLITSIQKHQANLEITSLFQEDKPSFELILAQALPRFAKLEWILEKSVELGVTEIWLFPGILSEKKALSQNQLERMHHIILSALKQCGRLFLPKVIIKPLLTEWDLLPKNGFFWRYKAIRSPFPFISHEYSLYILFHGYRT